MKTYSIIIPVFNEAENLERNFGKFVNWVNNYMKGQKKQEESIEIIFAEDGSTDGSYSILKQIKNQLSCLVKISHSSRRLGKGGGFKKAFSLATGDYVILYDCDLSVSPNQIPGLMEKISSGYDIVIGSRQLKETQLYNYPIFIRYIYGKILGIFAKLMFPFPFLDTQCGFKAFKKDLLVKVVEGLKITGWIFDLELILKSYYKGLRIIEIPTRYRFSKKSKINIILDPVKIIFDLLHLRLKVLNYYPIYPFEPNKRKL